MFNSNSGMLFGGIGMWLFWLLLIVIVAVAIKLLMRTGPSQTTKEDSPLDILEKRYATGEIDDEEYQRRRRGLKH